MNAPQAQMPPQPGAPAPAPGPKGWTPDQLSATTIGERRFPHLVLISVTLFFILALAWAAFFQIEEVARGDGRVITRTQVQVITNLEGGIISEIMVREGDVVQKDQPLMRIDPTRFESAYREGAQGAAALKAKVARLSAEVNRSALSIPAEVQKLAPVVARDEAALYRARQAEQAAKSQVLRQQMNQRESELRELQSRSERLAEQLVLVPREYTITAPLVKRGIVSEVELLRLEREQTRTQTDLEQARLSIPRTKAAIDEARGRLVDVEASFRAQAGGELSQAQAELAKVAEQI